jgi:hypothetical protein
MKELMGVAVVHQHRTLVNDLSVAENLFLGHLGSTWAALVVVGCDVSDLAHVFGDRDVDGDERDVRAGHETPFRLGCCRVDRHDGDQVDLLRDEILNLRGLGGEVSVWVAEVEDDLVATGFLHPLLDVLVKLVAS